MKKHLAILLAATITFASVPSLNVFADETVLQETSEVREIIEEDKTAFSIEDNAEIPEEESKEIIAPSEETLGTKEEVSETSEFDTAENDAETAYDSPVQQENSGIDVEESTSDDSTIKEKMSYAEEVLEELINLSDKEVIFEDRMEAETTSVTGITIKAVNFKKVFEGEFEVVDLPSSVKPGLTIVAYAEITPSDATNKAVTWSTSNKKVLEIGDHGTDQMRYINIVSPGTATLTAETVDGGKIATWKVTVTDPISSTLKINSVQNTEKGVKITWGKASGATGYEVHRKDGKGESEEITEYGSVFKKTSFTDTEPKEYDPVYNGHKLTYEVKAYKEYKESEIPVYAMPDGQIRYYKAAQKTIYWLDPLKVKNVKNNAAKSLTVTWGKNAKGNGYQIQYSTDKNFKNAKTVTVTSAKTTSKKITGLKKNETYYVRIRPYKTVSKTKYYGAWSKYSKGMKVKK